MTWRKHIYLWMTLDPVHIGAGGYRLGRVDLSIVREPGTNLPKIPGTSLSGAARSYAAMRNGDLGCAGQGGHCGDEDCPVCYTFGTTQDGRAYAGVVNIYDAHLLLFPVHTMIGPVWVTSPERLRLIGLTQDPPEDDKAIVGSGFPTSQHKLNLGWLLLNTQNGLNLSGICEKWSGADECRAVEDRIVLVSDKLYGRIVNANLEVRTSVSIDPNTGAAEDGALFTYEAIPRSAFLVSEVVEDSFRKNDLDILPLDVVRGGFEMIEWLGVGGMGTRGMGRMCMVGQPKEEELPK